MVRITGRRRLLIRHRRPTHAGPALAWAFVWIFGTAAVLVVPLFAPFRPFGQVMLGSAGFAFIALLGADSLRDDTRSFVMIDLRAGQVTCHRRGLLRWRTQGALTGFAAIDLRDGSSSEGPLWQLRLQGRDGGRSQFLANVYGPLAEARPLVLRLSAATGLPLSAAAQGFLDRPAG